MPYLIVGYVSIWLLWMPLRFYTRRKGNKNLSTVFKIIPTLLAASFAGWACLTHINTDTTSWLLFVGVLIGTCADAALEYLLQLGGLLFFVAHCLFIVALMRLCPPNGWFVLVFVVALLFGVWFLSHYQARFPDRKLRIGVALYVVTLSALLGVTMPAPFLIGGTRVLIGAIGAGLFVISDATLCRNSVEHRIARDREVAEGGLRPEAERRRIIEEYLSLGCYYTAQTAFALCAIVSLSA